MSFLKIECEIIVCDALEPDGKTCGEEFENGEYTPHFRPGKGDWDMVDGTDWQLLELPDNLLSHRCFDHNIQTSVCAHCQGDLGLYGLPASGQLDRWRHRDGGKVACANGLHDATPEGEDEPLPVVHDPNQVEIPL